MSYEYEAINQQVAQNILKRIKHIDTGHIKIMEVCGTHTMAIMKYGIKELLPKNIELISGPGCPVCVTSQGYIDAVVELIHRHNMIITTFGDMIKVPGTNTSLKTERALGKDIRIVYSPLQSLEIAKQNPDKEVVFLGVGFETTTPIIALSIEKAKSDNIKNFAVFQSLKTMPNIIKKLILDQDVDIDGFILPGHVVTVTGYKPFEFISEDYNMSGVVAGFELLDILHGIYELLKNIQSGTPKVKNLYSEVVGYEGNTKVKKIVEKIFEVSSSNWRGLGIIEDTGLQIREEYKEFDAKEKFNITINNCTRQTKCICGDILKGECTPNECKMFESVCSPSNPLGPCMVSEEGTCAAYYKYDLGR
ncbi:MAG TPA: hydrogenase formation protein HypD [Clostridiales bacterium]|nr:MAG: hydrogenase formation protein HypD [Clostridiales bacterium GWD2_32_59]HAN09658.1 hydrogenase formation protein HypD [Clostridiales bacterium]